MRRSLKIPLLIVGGLVAAILLVSGGFLLGARDDLSSALRGLFPVVAGSSASADADQLQQEVLDKLDSTYYKAVDDAKLHADAIDGMVAGAGRSLHGVLGSRRSTPRSRRAPPAPTPVWG